MAQHVDVIMTRLNNFVDKQLTSLSQSNPMMAFAKPLITRVIDNNAYKVEGMLKQIADKDGMVDVNGILSEMIDNVISALFAGAFSKVRCKNVPFIDTATSVAIPFT